MVSIKVSEKLLQANPVKVRKATGLWITLLQEKSQDKLRHLLRLEEFRRGSRRM